MYPSQPPQQPYPQPDPNQQPYAPYGQQPYAPAPGGEAYGMPPNPYAPPSTPMQPPYAPPSTPLQQPYPYGNPYAPPSMPMQPQQPMYGGPMPAPNTLNFNAFTLPQNRGNLFAAAGGVVALLSFFLFDFWGVSASGVSFSFKATDLASGSFASIPLGHSYPLLWLVPLGALAAAAVAVIVVFGIRAIQGLTLRNAAIAITSASAIALACLLISVLQFNGDLGSGASASALGVSYGYGFGFWLTLLALLAALGGGILNLRQTQPTFAPPPPPYMGGGYPPQNPPM